MRVPLRHLVILGSLLALTAPAGESDSLSSTNLLRNWPQWRGPLANGVAPHANPPFHWNETNNIRWKIPLPGKGHSSPVVSSPVHDGHGVVISGNSYSQQAMLAIRLDGAKGDLTGTDRVAWRLNRSTPYVSSPLLYDDTLYFLRHNQNILGRLEPATGKPRGEPLRLAGISDFIFASPVGAAGRICVSGRDGVTVVLRHDRENAALAVNRLDDTFSASPALVDRELYLRGERFLYCSAEPGPR